MRGGGAEGCGVIGSPGPGRSLSNWGSGRSVVTELTLGDLKVIFYIYIFPFQYFVYLYLISILYV